MGSMFSQWVDGQPWWLTLLLLPAIVLAAVVAKLLRDVVIVSVLALLLALGVTVAAWLWGRRREATDPRGFSLAPAAARGKRRGRKARRGG